MIMYKTFYGFKDIPFSKDIKSQGLFMYPYFKELLSRMDYIKKYKGIMLITGEPGVGKTSLVKKFVSGRFTRDYRVSIGANLFVKDLILDSDIEVAIQIWDIAGQEKWEKMRHLYYKGAHGALIVGDITRENTFEQLKGFWSPDLKKFCGEIPKILVVNKNDLKPIISNNEVEDLAQNINVNTIFFSSAKNGQNVEEAFQKIAEDIIISKQKKKIVLLSQVYNPITSFTNFLSPGSRNCSNVF